MSDASVEVVTSGTSGVFVDVSQLTTGAGTVERQRMAIGDPATGAALAAVQNSDPAGTEYGLAVRNVEPTIPVKFDKAFDIGTSFIYVGYAVLGSATSAAVWTIKRITLTSGLPTLLQWSAANQIFDNRGSLTYT